MMASPAGDPASRVSGGQAGVNTDSPETPQGSRPHQAHRRQLRAGGMMSSAGRRRSTSERPARARPRSVARRWAIGLACAGLAATGLAACGTANASSGPVTLNFYFYPDTSTATVTAVKNCNAQSHGKYKIAYQVLPQASGNQRLEMVRRLAAHDDSMDILGLDVTWEAEFAQAGWIEPWTGAEQGGGRERHAQACPGDRDVEGQARRGTGQQQHPAAVVQLRAHAEPAQDLGPDAGRRGEAEGGGQAALHRDPGRPVRGRDRVVQHDGGQRGRHDPEPGRDQGDARARRRSRPCRS